MKKILTTLSVLVLTMSASAQSVLLKSENRDTAYVNTILQRSEKNISDLPLLHGSEEWTDVRNIVANRYFELNDIYEERDKTIKFAKDSLSAVLTANGLPEAAVKEARNKMIDYAKGVCDSKLYRSHFDFHALLSLYLNDEQITAVKDAITYNKVMVTYDAYLDEIPSLKAEEKKMIYAWLVEARELALDAENSKQKHEAFNKYKGRINNYLSKRGYDLDKERKAWFERLKKK